MSETVISAFGPTTFTVAELTGWLLAAPIVPSLIGSLNLFTARPLPTTTTGVERQDDRLALVPEQPRGAPANRNVAGTRSLVLFRVPHFPLSDTVMADAVQDRRAIGRTELASWSDLMQERVASMGRKLDVTEEHLRFGATRGVVITSMDRETGAILNSVDLFAMFGIAPPEPISFPMAGDSARTAASAWSGAIMSACRRVARQMQAVLMMPAPRIVGICGSDFFDELTGSAELRQTRLGTPGAAALRESPLFQPTSYGGIDFYDYGGAMVGAMPFMPPDECQFVPVGIPELFAQAYSPAPYADTVNTIAMPRYARQERLDYNKGIEIEAQINTLPICTNPKCLLTGKMVEAATLSVTAAA